MSAVQAVEGNHDNPVSHTHQAASHVQRGGKGELRAKQLSKATARKGNISKMIDFCESAVKLLKRSLSPRPPTYDK